jgi:hypothetical protein
MLGGYSLEISIEVWCQLVAVGMTTTSGEHKDFDVGLAARIGSLRLLTENPKVSASPKMDYSS